MLGLHPGEHLARRSFATYVGLTAGLPRFKRVVPDFVAAVIAALGGLERIGIAPHTKTAGDLALFAIVAMMPLTDMLAATGPFNVVPIVDWMITGGVPPKHSCMCTLGLTRLCRSYQAEHSAASQFADSCLPA